jgi:hypothetical protein
MQTHSSPMAALEWIADIEPGGMSALINTGRSEVLEMPKSNGSYWPDADTNALVCLRGISTAGRA